MTQTIPAKVIDLRYLIDNFGIELVLDGSFFREWQEDLPEINDLDKQLLDKVKTGYFNLLNYPPFLENVVRMAVIDPLLFIGDFYLAPYYVKSEESIDIAVPDEDVIIKGRIDTLVLKEQFWLMIIESKRASFSVEQGLAQILAYLLGNRDNDKLSFGMIATGSEFIFVKLVKGNPPRYALSKGFLMRNPGNELYDVLRILKRLTQLVGA
ncbi:MAG: restriction endonuclease subunit R [Nostoc sp. DedQUE08]|uniref:restriction endonuclease subunit R n=1 Tax=unclassified Nostoc TaxID=2593658 RepID=UPI002AD51EE9|nr:MULTISPECIES: restriction endonuclease subunit R [unclassified Nostoc]MDZ8066793.1 restriction endonuclease subunit R [Nostoc sp. DedQUE08]MDZ8094792.1 restriction endonuclease subunit R [Nostoc sp. DedQUE05]